MLKVLVAPDDRVEPKLSLIEPGQHLCHRTRSDTKTSRMKPTVDVPEQTGADQPFRTALFHHSPAASLITRISDGEIVEVNEAFCRLTGYRREELIGTATTTLGLYANPGDRERLLAAFRRDGRVQDLELDVCRRSGEIRSVVASYEAISMDGSDCFLGTAIDITGRKRAERALTESESRFRHLTTMTNDLFYSCRRHGGRALPASSGWGATPAACSGSATTN